MFVSGHINDWPTGHDVCSEYGKEPLLQLIGAVKETDVYSITKVW